MVSFIDLPPLFRSIICTVEIIFIVCLFEDMIYSFVQKRWDSLIVAISIFFIPYGMFHICAEVSNYKRCGYISDIAETYARLPGTVYIFINIVILIVIAIKIRESWKYEKEHITPLSIKESADGLPVGLCYYNSQGSPLLINHKIEELSYAIDETALRNGYSFEKTARKKLIHEVDGEFFRFKYDTLAVNGEKIYEIIADNITEIYKKTEVLKTENEKLRMQNVIVKEYGEKINEIVRREEILKTKIGIHDGMNKVLLKTDNAIRSNSPEERKNILKIWEKNLLYLCMDDREEKNDNICADLEELAKLIGITLHVSSVPKSVSNAVLRIFVQAAEEAMVNAVKHGNAKNFYIQTEQNEKELIAVYANDGDKQTANVTERGGLSNLRTRLSDVNGELNISYEPQFSIEIKIPVKEEKNV